MSETTATDQTDANDDIQALSQEVIDRIAPQLPNKRGTMSEERRANLQNRAATLKYVEEAETAKRELQSKIKQSDGTIAELRAKNANLEGDKDRADKKIADLEEQLRDHKAHDAVATRVAGQICREFGWEINSSSTEMCEDASTRYLRSRMEFDGGYRLVVMPSLGYLTIEIDGMHPQKANIDSNGITPAGWLTLNGFCYLQSLDTEARKKLTRKSYDAFYVTPDTKTTPVTSQKGSSSN